MGCCGRIWIAILLGLAVALAGSAAAKPKKALSTTPASSTLKQENILQPDMVTARKAAIQDQLEALERGDTPEEERDQKKVPLDETLALLTAIETAWQKRDYFQRQLDTLPQQLKELEAERKALETRPPSQFPEITEPLRDQYEAKLQAVQTNIQGLLKQTADGEVRLVAIPQELEQRTIERPQLEKRLAEARRQQPPDDESVPPVPQVAQLEAKLQLVVTEIQALDTERQWLMQQGSFHDSMLRLAQTRLTHTQQDLAIITRDLGRTIGNELSTLQQKREEIEHQLRQLEEASDPVEDPVENVEKLRLTAELETIQHDTETATYRKQLNELSDAVLAQDEKNLRERQDVDHFNSLFEKYASGESGGQLLLVAFERLRRERERVRGRAVQKEERQLRRLTEQLFTVEDQLYSFDRQAAERIADELPLSQQADSPQYAPLRKAFDQQKIALRGQQQVLSQLLQEQNTLLTRHREYKRLLNDSYHSALAKMFWLRDAEPFNRGVLQAVIKGIGTTVIRFPAFVQAELSRVQSNLPGAIQRILLVLTLFVGLPWLAFRVYRRLREQVELCLASCSERELPPGGAELFLVLLRAAVWPVYMLLLAWAQVQVVQHPAVPYDHAVMGGLQVSALILWVALIGWDILRPSGWGQQFWGWRPELCRFLHMTLLIGCLAALILLVPRHILLIVPGETPVEAGSLALARALLLVFQGVLFVLIAIIGWRGSPLMADVLSRSREREGLLWRLWPMIYITVLAGWVGILALDGLGYRYAARFIWLRTLESLAVLMAWRLLAALLLLRGLHHIVAYIARKRWRGSHSQEQIDAASERLLHITYTIGNAILGVFAFGVVLELWGVSASWLVTSPTGADILHRLLFIALCIGAAITIIKVSKAVSDYLLQPRAAAQDEDYETRRKFKTMVPLIHTLFKFGVVFAAVMVCLELLSVATGPILTGIGIFGLAVGFASQSLIKDVINGLFILFEDSLSVGDWVTLRTITGQVEKVTLRAVSMRDLDGNVHIIPNSTLDMITNMTKEYGRSVLDIGVAYRENVDDVMEILRDIGREMYEEPVYRWQILEPVDVLGVHAFADSAVIIRVRLKTRAGKQWALAREYRRRVKNVFDEHGIEIPFPHQTLYWGAPKDGSQAPLPVTLAPHWGQKTGNGVESMPSDERSVRDSSA